jgi:hypothetical protein
MVHQYFSGFRLKAEMQEEEEELQLEEEDLPDKALVAGEEDRVEEAMADDMVTLPPESEPEDGESSLLDGIGDDLSRKSPRGEPRVDYSNPGKKQGTSLDPVTSARLHPTLDARKGGKSKSPIIIWIC